MLATLSMLTSFSMTLTLVTHTGTSIMLVLEGTCKLGWIGHNTKSTSTNQDF